MNNTFHIDMYFKQVDINWSSLLSRLSLVCHNLMSIYKWLYMYLFNRKAIENKMKYGDIGISRRAIYEIVWKHEQRTGIRSLQASWCGNHEVCVAAWTTVRVLQVFHTVSDVVTTAKLWNTLIYSKHHIVQILELAHLNC